MPRFDATALRPDVAANAAADLFAILTLLYEYNNRYPHHFSTDDLLTLDTLSSMYDMEELAADPGEVMSAILQAVTTVKATDQYFYEQVRDEVYDAVEILGYRRSDD